jgi:hypothetical protein
VVLTLSDGHGNTVQKTKAATSGAGTVTFTGVDASTLVDGSVGISAVAKSSYGDASQAAMTTAPKDTVAPATPTSVTLTNGGGSGSAFINSANKASLNYNVVEPTSANNSTTDTVSLKLSSSGGGTPVTTTNSGQGSSGGTVSFSGINASALTDGTMTATATVTDTAGNTSATATTTNTKDTVAPATPTSVALSNGGGIGSAFINSANKTSLNYNVVEPTSANNSTTDTVSVSLTSVATVSGTTTGQGSAGGTASVTAINATTLTDGTVTATAKVTDAAGNASATATTTNTKDTVAPAAPTGLSYGDSNGADHVKGTAEANSIVSAVRTTPSCTGGCGVFSATLTGGATTFDISVDRNNGSTSSPLSVTYSVTAADAAGNVSSAATLSASDTN